MTEQRKLWVKALNAAGIVASLKDSTARLKAKYDKLVQSSTPKPDTFGTNAQAKRSKRRQARRLKKSVNQRRKRTERQAA